MLTMGIEKQKVKYMNYALFNDLVTVISSWSVSFKEKILKQFDWKFLWKKFWLPKINIGIHLINYQISSMPDRNLLENKTNNVH